MELSPEEKQRIYEEEKIRIEARQQIEREKQNVAEATSTGLTPNVAALLCYVGSWITGIIFFILEQKNNLVRFHAAQSIVVFGTVTVMGTLLIVIPIVGSAFSSIVYIIGLIVWIVLMVKAYKGERYKLSWAGDIAEKMVASPGTTDEGQKQSATAEPEETASTRGIDADKPVGKQVEEFFKSKREGRITAPAFAIAWSVALLIFFNFFNEFVAYYQSETVGSITIWTRYPLFTNDVNLWLPVLTTTLVITIAGHIVLIIFDRYILREVMHIVIDAFRLGTVVTLVSIFPFDFNAIPNTIIVSSVNTGVYVILICISVALGIGILVRSIKLIVHIIRGITSYANEC
ncbi:DUF4870 domain-containing protein [Chloroflexota bacterium]